VLGGIGSASWSLVMMSVAFLLGVSALLLRGDATLCLPIAWGLLAISAQQKSPNFPGDDRVVAAGAGLGATLFALAGAAVLAASRTTTPPVRRTAPSPGRPGVLPPKVHGREAAARVADRSLATSDGDLGSVTDSIAAKLRW
jgi:hypothetical protein